MDYRTSNPKPAHREVPVSIGKRLLNSWIPYDRGRDSLRFVSVTLVLAMLLATGGPLAHSAEAQIRCRAHYEWGAPQGTQGLPAPLNFDVDFNESPPDGPIKWTRVDTIYDARLDVFIGPISDTDNFEFGSLGNFQTSPGDQYYERKDLIATFGHQTLLDFLKSNDGKFTIKWTDTDDESKMFNLIVEMHLPLDACQKVEITSPTKDTTVVAGEDFKITWKSRDVDSLYIWFSADSGKVKTYLTNIATVASEPSEYVWSVPDTLTREAFIRLVPVENNALDDTSGVFKIKPYVLTRVDQNGDYEVFDPANHGWSFCNCDGNLAPWSYSQTDQFLYHVAVGEDPFSLLPYDENLFANPPYLANPNRFADWPSFVTAFNTRNFYLGSPFNGSYRTSGVTTWFDYSDEEWNGSCSGMTLSALMAFADKNRFGAHYPAIGVVDEIHSAAAGQVPDHVRAVINELYAYFDGDTQQNHAAAHLNDRPRATLAALKSMLLDEDEKHSKDSYLFIGDSTGAHAVAPTKLTRISKSPSQWWLEIYDPNEPDVSKLIEIDSTADTWKYRPDYDGNGEFFLMDPITNYYPDAVYKAATANRSLDSRLAKTDLENDTLRMFTTSWAMVKISGSAGEIGYASSAAFNSMEGARFFLAPSGYDSSPVFYELQGGEYHVEVSSLPDSTSYFGIERGNTTFRFVRYDASAEQTDRFFFDGGVGVANSDSGEKQVYLVSVVDLEDHERVSEVHKFRLASGDSLYTATEENDALRLQNHGNAVTYDLVLRRASPDMAIRFHAVGVPIGAGAHHRISPDWENLDTEPVEIEIDADGDGTYEGSMQVRNNVSVEDLGIRSDELPTRFDLKQNYPNPFNPSTTIAYDVPKESDVRITVFDALGRLVEVLGTWHSAPGSHTVTWDAASKPSGVYFYRLEAGQVVLTRSMFLAK